MRTVERRLEALEKHANLAAGAAHLCWQANDETPFEAMARRWPEGAPRGRLVFISWQGEDHAPD